MKAVVLSCDRYHKITNHMITTYQHLWPSNQLKFLIPYNEKYPKFLEDKWGEKVEFVKTPVEFKKCYNSLLSSFINKVSRQPNIEEIRNIQAATYAICS